MNKEKQVNEKQVQALKEASHLVFNFDGLSSYISAIKIVRGIHDEKLTFSLNIDCDTRIHNYGVSRGLGKIKKAHHLESINTDKYSHIPTILHKISAGDILTLHWFICNNSNLLDDAGLIKDELYLSIEHEQHVETYFIRSQVSKDNSARMILTESTFRPSLGL